MKSYSFSFQILVAASLFNIYSLHAFNLMHNSRVLMKNHGSATAVSSKLFMNIAEWHTVAVVDNKQEAIGLRKITIKTNSAVTSSYINPGQYVQMRGNKDQAKPGFFAIASGINSKTDDVLTFLVKETEGSQYLTKAGAGSAVEMSNAQGKGFPIVEYFQKYKSDFAVTNILLMACGSGLAPIAATIDSGSLGLGKPNFSSLFTSKATLYLGVKTEAHLPFTDRFAEWKAMGVNIIPVLSQAPPESAGVRRGYIQDALRSDTISVPRNTGVILCGQRGMVDDVKLQCLEAGVFEGRVLLNF